MNYRINAEKNQQTGFILIAGLVLLMLLSLIVMAAINMTQINAKKLQNEDLWQQAFYAAETGLQQVERLLLQDNVAKNCQHTAKAHDYFRYQPSGWWNSNTTCDVSRDGFSIRYVVEKLVESGCLKVQVSNNDIRPGGKYARITLLSQGPNKTEIWLQSTVLLPLVNPPGCRLPRPEILKVGMQSWREIF